MTSFKEFINQIENGSNKALPFAGTSLSAIETALTSTISGFLTPVPVLTDKKQEFAEKVSNVVRDEKFISEFSDRIGLPLEMETEDEFVGRSSDVLKKMLYDRFSIKELPMCRIEDAGTAPLQIEDKMEA